MCKYTHIYISYDWLIVEEKAQAWFTDVSA